MFDYAEMIVTENGRPALVVPVSIPKTGVGVRLYDDFMEFTVEETVIGRVPNITAPVIHWLSTYTTIRLLVFKDRAQELEKTVCIASIHDRRASGKVFTQ